MLHCPPNFTRSLVVCGIVFTSGFGTALAADPTGDWKVADEVANIRVAECNGSMWGVVAWEKTPGGRDLNNPDVSLQSRPTLGMPILIDMKKKTGADQWEGQVYNAKDGKLYSSTIKPVGSDKLEIQGCVLGFLCGGETWTRVAPPIPSSPSNSMAKGPPKAASGIKTTGLPGQPAQPKTVAPPPAPKTTGSTGPKTVAPGQKTAAAASGDVVGDICLLPDIARFAH
ncbi:DUF2147 domain-containing protein [Bradyrhizobium sp.]|jgi:uncharacterized protein (DUF2147 family)|uniref:DUF2147 domain-containing protein n=1 Tax=Bradyrhizobium sp. TaxID=376 RepID=UPI002E0BB86C|nr:DUF2147 domain-containing protein [Bradyrhizobium sp.]